MKLTQPIDERLRWIHSLHDLDDARSVGLPGARIDALMRAGRSLGDELKSGPRVRAVKTFTITPLIYPTRFAFNGVVPLPWPFIVMIHRTLLVQVDTDEGVKNLLFNPTDPEASQRGTPFFCKVTASIRRVAPFAESLMKRKNRPLVEQLADVGVTPDDIDVIAFDHFHTQDLRPILGTDTTSGRFPNALLLAPRREWEHWDSLHPMQRAWFVAEGKQGIPTDKVILTDHDLAIAGGALLLQTPGHTVGNQTLFVHGGDGVFGCSENGCSADNWSPRASSIPGMRRYADLYDVDVVLNSNTPELGGEQYASMILERSVVDTVPGRPEQVQMFPSSEVTPSPLAPGVTPKMLFGDRDSGTLETTAS